MDILTLFKPSSLPNVEKSDTITYKNVTEFKDNQDGTISFKTQKFGEILTCLKWRYAKNVPAATANTVEETTHTAAPVRAGNRARNW